MKKYIVTGACGFIGYSVASKLLVDGNIVYCVDIDLHLLNETFRLFKRAILIESNFAEYKFLHEKIVDTDIACFFHFAFLGKLTADTFKNFYIQTENINATCEALIEAKTIGAKKFIFSSSSNVIDTLNYILSNSANQRYTNIYSSAKMATDSICKTLAYNEKIEYCCGMICMVYGERNKSKILPNILIENLLNGTYPPLVEGNNLYDLIYINDVANAFIAIADKGINMKTYYIGHRKLITFKEWIIKFKDVINPSIELHFGEYEDVKKTDYSIINLDELYNDTGFQCSYPLEESILNTAKRYKENMLKEN